MFLPTTTALSSSQTSPSGFWVYSGRCKGKRNGVLQHIFFWNPVHMIPERAFPRPLHTRLLYLSMGDEHCVWKNSDFLHFHRLGQYFSHVVGVEHETVRTMTGAQQSAFRSSYNSIENRRLVLVMIKIVVANLCLSMASWQKLRTPVAGNQSECDLHSDKSQKSSHHPDHTCSSACWLAYISLKA